MPSLADMEQWLEEQWPDSLRDLPQQVSDKAHEYYCILYQEISRYGPSELPLPEGLREQLQSLQEMVLPGTISPPPPPPPPPGVLRAALHWAKDHPYTVVAGVSATSVGLGLAYARVYPDSARAVKSRIMGRPVVPVRRAARVRNGIRREAVIILGADTPLGRALLMSLTSQGLIVIAAVSSAARLKSFDAQLLPSSRGYVAVRHFDLTSLPGSVDGFVAEVKSALALRFPLNAPGDPFARPGDGAILIGIINALSYVSAEDPSSTDPSMSSGIATSAASAGAALQRALSVHVTAPISAISALLPELRVGPQRIYTQNPEYLTPLTVLTLVDGAAAKAESGNVARLVTESATSAASTLRESGSAHNAAQAGARMVRKLRFTVLTLPPVSSQNTWTAKDQLTQTVDDAVSDLILASDADRQLRPVTRVTLPGPSVGVIFAPLWHALSQAQLKLFSSLPQPVVAWLEACYRALSTASRQVRINVRKLAPTRRRRARGSHDDSHATSANSALVKRDSTPDRVRGYNLDLPMRGSTPRPSHSGPGSVELDAPSSLETGSSADDDDVLRSAPSSTSDEEEDRGVPSPHLGTRSAPAAPSPLARSSSTDPSSTEAKPSSQGSTPNASQQWGTNSSGSRTSGLDQSWVQLGEASSSDSQQHQQH